MGLLVQISGVIETGVLIILVGLSIWSVAVMLDRRKALKAAINSERMAQAKSAIRQRDWETLKNIDQDIDELTSGTLIAIQDSRSPEQTERACRAYLIENKSKLEKGFTVLATLGSNAPFIGLFGTVLGIIRAFAALSNDSAGAESVMAGISSALIATAAGLFVAIPAVIAFNAFSRELQVMLSDCESLRDLYSAYRFDSQGSRG